ncbi:MAG: 8-amino-7-oxononanoate synthase [Lentisphaeria bacterium]|nr:8-amino-7-oxononanoate synthase [Lentisphaeria bacterium]
MRCESWIESELCELRTRHLKRELRTVPDAGGRIVQDECALLNFSSNDYLDFANRPSVRDAAAAALAAHGCGAGSSRLVTGTLPIHEQLERVIARHKGYPDALVFGSGFLANVGVIPALVGRDDTVFADKLVHASILDGVALSRARLVRFRHNDPSHLAQRLKNADSAGRRLVVIESVYSMDGDLAPLPELAALAEAHGAMLMVDEAHSTGVFGACGAGLVHQHGLQECVNISMGTLSKALGNYGGFIACSAAMKSWLVNRARAFIYTTAPPPAVMGGCLGAFEALEHEPDLGRTLLDRAERFRSQLHELGFDTGASESQIIPIMVGDSERALALSRRLREAGILAIAIRPPTVPEGTARLRLSVTLAHTAEDLDRTAQTLAEAARQEGVL